MAVGGNSLRRSFPPLESCLLDLKISPHVFAPIVGHSILSNAHALQSETSVERLHLAPDYSRVLFYRSKLVGESVSALPSFFISILFGKPSGQTVFKHRRGSRLFRRLFTDCCAIIDFRSTRFVTDDNDSRCIGIGKTE